MSPTQLEGGARRSHLGWVIAVLGGVAVAAYAGSAPAQAGPTESSIAGTSGATETGESGAGTSEAGGSAGGAGTPTPAPGETGDGEAVTPPDAPDPKPAAAGSEEPVAAPEQSTAKKPLSNQALAMDERLKAYACLKAKADTADAKRAGLDATAIQAKQKAADDACVAAETARQTFTDRLIENAGVQDSVSPETWVDPRTMIRKGLRVRCMTALCFGQGGNEYGVEPVLDLPLTISWATGDSSLARYINSHRMGIDLNFGARFWVAHDVLSFMVVASTPVVAEKDKLHITGSTYEYGSNQISRPYPSLGLGFLGDTFQLLVSYDRLVNSDAGPSVDPNYEPNAVVSKALTFSFGFAPITALRTAAGIADTEKETKAND